MCVGAVDDRGITTPFSSLGPTRAGVEKPDILAPGVIKDGEEQGTSYASPYVAGIISLLMADQKISSEDVMEKIRKSNCYQKLVDFNSLINVARSYKEIFGENNNNQRPNDNAIRERINFDNGYSENNNIIQSTNNNNNSDIDESDAKENEVEKT